MRPCPVLLVTFVSTTLFVIEAKADHYSFTLLNAPGAVSTVPYGFFGGGVYGYSFDASGTSSAFRYDGNSFQPLNSPVGLPNRGWIKGTSGTTQVGFFDSAGGSHGYVFDGTALTVLDDPLAGRDYPNNGTHTYATGVSGDTVVGYYESYSRGISEDNGFIYRDGQFTTLDVPGATSTTITAIDGANIAGYCSFNTPTMSSTVGFIYNGSTFALLDDPLSSHSTLINGISGNRVVGTYYVLSPTFSTTAHGFVYDGTAFTTVNGPPGAMILGAGTELTGVSGNTIFGDYTLSASTPTLAQGFIATPSVPEPAALTGIAVLMSLLPRKRQSSSSNRTSWPATRRAWRRSSTTSRRNAAFAIPSNRSSKFTGSWSADGSSLR